MSNMITPPPEPIRHHPTTSLVMTDLRALIHRMADELDRYRQILHDDRSPYHPLAVEARAALAQPAPQVDGPSYQELADAFAEGCRDSGKSGEPPFLGGARAVLARWGRPTLPLPTPTNKND